MSKKWEPHKEEILRLYIVENLTLDQVMDHMLQTHGFNQKKSQYEYKLKLWGARKNVKKEVLEYLTHQDRKRGKPQGLNSGTYIVNGILLSAARVNRARQRHDIGLSLARMYGRAPSPQLPPGHHVRRASSGASEVVIDWPQSLPWLQFERRFNIVVPQSSRVIQILAQAIFDSHYRLDFNDPSDLARAIYAASNESPSNLARFLPYIRSGLRSSIVSTSPSNPTNIATEVLKAFLFQVANKMRNSRNVNLLVLFHELDKAYPLFLGQLISSNDQTSEAILESLYKSAVKYGATALLSRLLETGRDVNALLDIDRYFKHSAERGKASIYILQRIKPMTALQFAAFTCNIQLATILINAGAKADLGSPTPMQILFTSSEVDHSDVLRFACLLLCHGARVDVWNDRWASPLEGAVLSRNISFVHFLLQCGATESLQQSRKRYFIRYRFLETKEHLFMFSRRLHTHELTSPLQLAIILGVDNITEILVTSIAKHGNKIAIFEQAFITACIAGDRDLAQVILKHLDTQFQNNDAIINLAFYVSAWDTECQIAHLLLEHEAVRSHLLRSCLPITQVAALYGNVGLIALLISSGFDVSHGSSLKFELEDMDSCQRISPPSISSTPLGCAAWMGHNDVIKFLLDLGADVAGIDLASAIRARSDELIAIVLDQCENVDEPCNGERALDVAIRYRHGIRLIHKLIDVGAVIRGHEIVDAIRSDDQEVVNFLLQSCDVVGIISRDEIILEAACCTGNLNIVQFYFSHGGVYGSRALLLAVSRAVEMHDYCVIEHIVANRPSGPIDEYEASALALSIQMEDATLMNMLLHDPFRPSTALSIYCGWFGLQDAEKIVADNVYPFDYNNIDIGIERLIQKTPCSRRVHDRDERFSPFLVAALLKQEESLRTMLDRGYLPDPRFATFMLYRPLYIGEDIRNKIMSAYHAQILHVSDQDWHQRMLNLALRDRANFRIIQQHLTKLTCLDFEVLDGFMVPWSPLKAAAGSNNCDYVRIVLEAGATADSRKWPQAADAFRTAVIYGNIDIVLLLMDHGASINDRPHATINHTVELGNFKLMFFLLDHGLDINAPVSFMDSSTCLELAAKRGSIDAVELLLSRGLDIQGRARIHFVRAMVFAMQECNYATAKLLKKRGGWDEEDEEIAKTPRATDFDSCCPRFLYDDLSLECCSNCEEVSHDSSSISDSSEADASATSSPPSYEAPDEQFTAYEIDPLTDGLSIMDIDTDTMDYEQTTSMSEWPDASSNQQDMELDMIVKGLLLEDGIIFDSI